MRRVGRVADHGAGINQPESRKDCRIGRSFTR
jgi:hypothetical protein